jgi:hypothetical protein
LHNALLAGVSRVSEATQAAREEAIRARQRTLAARTSPSSIHAPNPLSVGPAKPGTDVGGL